MRRGSFIYGNQIGPALKCSQVLAAFRAGATIEAQKNPPGAGPSGSREYVKRLTPLPRPWAGRALSGRRAPIAPPDASQRPLPRRSLARGSYEEETRSLASAFSRSLRHLRTRQSVCSSSRSIDAGRNGGRRLAISAVAATNVRATFNTAGLLLMRRYCPVLVRWDVRRSTGPIRSKNRSGKFGRVMRDLPPCAA